MKEEEEKLPTPRHNETAANASMYIACKGIYESKTRSTKLGENDAKHCLMTNVSINFFLPVFCIKAAASAPHGNAARRK